MMSPQGLPLTEGVAGVLLLGRDKLNRNYKLFKTSAMANKIGNLNADDAMKAEFKDCEYIKIDDVVFIRKDKALELCNRAHAAQNRNRKALQLRSVVVRLFEGWLIPEKCPECGKRKWRKGWAYCPDCMGRLDII